MKRTLAWAALAALSLTSMWWVAEDPSSTEGSHGPDRPLEDRHRVDTLPDPPVQHVTMRRP